MEDYNLHDREFKIVIMKKLIEIQENSNRQFSELRTKINEQKEYFIKEIETVKNNQSNSGAKELSKWDEEFIRKHWKTADHMKERITKLKDRKLEKIQVEEEREVQFKKKNLREVSESIKKGNTRKMGIPEGEERKKWTKTYSKK